MTEEDYKNIADMIKERLTIHTLVEGSYEDGSNYIRVTNRLKFNGFVISEDTDYISV